MFFGLLGQKKIVPIALFFFVVTSLKCNKVNHGNLDSVWFEKPSNITCKVNVTKMVGKIECSTSLDKIYGINN